MLITVIITEKRLQKPKYAKFMSKSRVLRLGPGGTSQTDFFRDWIF